MKRIYSSTLQAFISKSIIFVKEILTQEFGVTLRRTRFSYQEYNYPISVALFEDKTKIGQFDPTHLQILLNRNLFYTQTDNIIKDILRHEIAHYFTYIKYGSVGLDHGFFFKSTCHEFNLSPDIAAAKVDLNLIMETRPLEIKNEQMLNTVKKLLKLAESSNKHEAELATIKANQILTKYHLENIDLTSEDLSETHVQVVLEMKKATQKHSAIAAILKTFHVYPVFTKNREGSALEVTGDALSVELAEYVASFLDQHLEFLWEQEAKENPFRRGVIFKNSFMRGVSAGYRNKLKATQTNQEIKNALVLIDNSLQKRVAQVYPHLSKAKSSAKHDSTSYNSGIAAGSALSINPAINSKSNQEIYLLS